MEPQGDATRAVRGPQRDRSGPLSEPVYQHSTWVVATADELEEAYGADDVRTYTRYHNPTLDRVGRRIAELEGCPAGLVTASGMAAITTTILAFVPAGGRIVATDCLYGGTQRFLQFLSERHKVDVTFVQPQDTAGIERALEQRADLLYLETPTNPTLRLVDLAAAADAARRAGVPAAVDSTFATPVNSRPHELGIDLVLHSATKYLGGHNDILAGAVCGSADQLERIWSVYKMMGPVLDPHAAFLLERGIKTLHARVPLQNRNAQTLAEHLEGRRGVQKVHYPGLGSHPQHDLARKQMPGGCGGVLSFDLPSVVHAKRFLDALELIPITASLGGVETIASIPYLVSHRGLPPDRLAAQGVTPGTVRVACGIEDPADLVADVDRGLAESLGA